MRAIELAKVAAAAEALRLRRLARRQAIRAAMGAGAAVFGLAAFATLHFLAFVLLALFLPQWLAVLIVLIIDLVIAGVFAMVAMNSKPGRIEREAQEIRRESLEGARKSLTVLSVAGEISGFALKRSVRRTLRRPGLNRALMVADIVSRVVRRR